MVSAADHLAPSAQPPAGLAAEEVPMFVMIGFDDNPNIDPMNWIVDYAADLTNPAGHGQSATFDGAPVRFAFYSNGKYLDESPGLRDIHLKAWQAGHEIANHTHNHFHGGQFTTDQWLEEMQVCQASLVACGIPAGEITGFRTPFLEYNDHMFTAARKMGFVYDTSIEEGYQNWHDGTNFLWPYTMEEGSPGNAWTKTPGAIDRAKSHPGFWQIPIHAFMVPADEESARYGVEPGLVSRMHSYIAENGGWNWPAEARKISGLDWNVMEMAGRQGPEFLAILKHTLDLRLAGNRAPMMIGAHTAMFPAEMPDRREAIEAFVAYALDQPEVRIVTPMQLIAWLRDPVSLAP
jgi:peptidoglycan/xylan/chitin deacetylase (PgdA/CDA1 family)